VLDGPVDSAGASHARQEGTDALVRTCDGTRVGDDRESHGTKELDFHGLYGWGERRRQADGCETERWDNVRRGARTRKQGAKSMGR